MNRARHKMLRLLFTGLVSGMPAGAVADAGAGTAGHVTEERVLAQAAGGNNWPVNGGNFRGEHFSPLADIDDGNVGKLGLAWYRDIDAPDGISATPIVVDGVIYISAPFAVVHAVDARSGEMLWSYDPGVEFESISTAWTARSNRGVAVWRGRVMVATGDCRLIALDAASGAELWSRVTCDPALGYSISDAPRVGGGKVFVGNAGSESRQKNRGYVTAYEVETGKPLWRFYTVPSDRPEENDTPALKMAAKTWTGGAWQEYGGGGSNWNEMTYDPESNLLYFGTAGALPYVAEERSPDGGDNLFLSSVLAVDADTGEYAWHYQTVPRDSWEYNATMNIILADLELDGRERRVLMIAPKNGFFYVLDRYTGELLSARKYAKVNWATHVDLKTGRPVVTGTARYWEHGDGEPTYLWPNMWGAHSWNPMAWHPGHRLAYIPVIEVPEKLVYIGDVEYEDSVVVPEQVDGKPHVPGRLLAWDPVRQAPHWEAARELPFNGGVLATGGNLVFQGTGTGAFEAYAADTGEHLWSVATGSHISAAPVSYLVDDEQYVLIPVGGGGSMQHIYPDMHQGADARGPARLLAFRLNGTAALPPAGGKDRALAEPPPLSADTKVIDRGAVLYHSFGCNYCHGTEARARVGGSVPDLRYLTTERYRHWNDVVIDGVLKEKGMLPFDMSARDAEAIRSYVISEAWKAYEATPGTERRD